MQRLCPTISYKATKYMLIWSTCQIISIQTGSFDRVNLAVLGIVIKAVILYIVILPLNIEKI